MVQYDPFAPLLVNTDLPVREKHMGSTSGNNTPSLVDSPTSMNSGLQIPKREAPRSHGKQSLGFDTRSALSSQNAS
jgi:hypothetical protein